MIKKSSLKVRKMQVKGFFKNTKHMTEDIYPYPMLPNGWCPELMIMMMVAQGP